MGITFIAECFEKTDKSGLRELRIKHSPDIYRVFFFAYVGQKFVLLHAIMKKQDKTPEKDIRIALERMTEFKSRNPGLDIS